MMTADMILTLCVLQHMSLQRLIMKMMRMGLTYFHTWVVGIFSLFFLPTFKLSILPLFSHYPTTSHVVSHLLNSLSEATINAMHPHIREDKIK